MTVVIDKNKMPDPWWIPVDAVLADLAARLGDAQAWQGAQGRQRVPLLIEKRAKSIVTFSLAAK